MIKQDYKDLKSVIKTNALTAVGYLLRHALYISIALFLIAVVSIDLDKILG